MASRELQTVDKGNARYPPSLVAHLKYEAPETVTAIGNMDILERPTLALFSSVKCPGDLILKTYDLATELRDQGVPVIGGFHSPMEKDCLGILLKGKQPIVICPARSIDTMRIPKEWKTPLDQGRLLILSPFSPGQNRTTAALAERRNLFVAALAATIFIVHAQPGSKTQDLARQAIAWSKPVHTFDHPANSSLTELGVDTAMELGTLIHRKDEVSR